MLGKINRKRAKVIKCLQMKHKSLKISNHIQGFYRSPFWLKQSEKKSIQG